MDDPKIIEVSTNLITDDPDIFFTWFESKFIAGRHFTFDDRSFLMSTGVLIPLRKDNTLTILIQHDLFSRLQGDEYFFPKKPVESTLKIEAIKSPHGGIDVKAVCNTSLQEFESFFRDIWAEIAAKQSASINEPIAEQLGSGIVEKADKLHARWDKMSPKTKKNFREAWKILERMRKAYRLEKLDGQTKEAQPKIKDWQTKVTKDLHWNVSESRLRDVKEMGESKILK